MLATSTDPAPPEPETVVTPAFARNAIAATLSGPDAECFRIGDVTLHPHQRSAASRIRRTLTEYGGALLCDEMGLGKTYVALAVAASFDSVTVVAPASLAGMWRRALEMTRIRAELMTVESLGRSGPGERRRSLLVVDEAHHFRNPCTRRYAALARMCVMTPVLLLTGTPLHNSRDDIAAIAALFAGSRTYAMTDAELAPMIVRRDDSTAMTLQHIPVVEHARRRVIISDETILDDILALPAPVPPSGGSIATRLVVHGLVRQWVSSNAALVGALKRRIARSHGLLASLDAGRYPTSAELSAWSYASDALQLAFAELLVPAADSLVSLTVALRAHLDALTALLARARAIDEEPLVAVVREIILTHPDERVVAFTCYAETAETLYRALRHSGHIGLLTARGAMIASGPVARTEILSQFAPSSMAAAPMHDHERVRTLVTTDLLSEGVNLQEASVVVHLDLPWTAARLQQRIGRLARMGSPHARVLSYAIDPPPRAEAFLREIDIIARKSGASAQFLGTSWPTDATVMHSRGAVANGEATRQIIERWRESGPFDWRRDSCSLVAYLATPHRGALGVWAVDGAPVLLALNEAGQITDEPPTVERAARVADRSAAAAAQSGLLAVAAKAARAWYQQRRARELMGDAPSHGGRTVHDVRRSLARVADATITNAGFARRATSAILASRLRDAATLPLPIAVEWSLENLSDDADDSTVSTILDLVERTRAGASRVHSEGFRCIAILVFVPRATHEG